MQPPLRASHYHIAHWTITLAATSDFVVSARAAKHGVIGSVGLDPSDPYVAQLRSFLLPWSREAIEEAAASEEKLDTPDLAARIAQRFDLVVHWRTVQRALARLKKKRDESPSRQPRQPCVGWTLRGAATGGRELDQHLSPAGVRIGAVNAQGERGRTTAAGDILPRNPTTGIAGCCACAASGHAAAAAPPRIVMNLRRLMGCPQAKGNTLAHYRIAAVLCITAKSGG
jgi:hypothetical protein